MVAEKDLISRQAVIDALKGMAVPLYKDPACEDIWERDRTLDNAIDAIRGLPSADRPQGKWKVKSFHECFCHNCGFSFDIMKCEFLENMKYCPNCGVPKGADNE